MSSFYHEHWWQAAAQRLLAFLKDSPTYSEMPLQGRDLVPPVPFGGKFCSRTFCGFRENIPRQPVRNPVVADVHGPVDVGFISCRNRMQHQLIFPALDRRVFFALNLRAGATTSRWRSAWDTQRRLSGRGQSTLNGTRRRPTVRCRTKRERRLPSDADRNPAAPSTRATRPAGRVHQGEGLRRRLRAEGVWVGQGDLPRRNGLGHGLDLQVSGSKTPDNGPLLEVCGR